MVSIYSSLVKQLSEGAELVANKPSGSLSSLVEKVTQLCGGPGRSSGCPAEWNLNWCGSNVASLVF